MSAQNILYPYLSGRGLIETDRDTERERQRNELVFKVGGQIEFFLLARRIPLEKARAFQDQTSARRRLSGPNCVQTCEWSIGDGLSFVNK